MAERPCRQQVRRTDIGTDRALAPARVQLSRQTFGRITPSKHLLPNHRSL
jgi:hypothetical protein